MFEVVDLELMVKNRENAIELKPPHPKIEFKDVSFSYPRAEEISLASLESAAKPETIQSGEVLRGLSFTAAPGTLTALVGPSGAGKTTISALLPRLYDVTTGAIEIDGHDIRDLTLESLRGSIGVVMQDAHLFHETIAENLRYAKNDATEDETRVGGQLEVVDRDLGHLLVDAPTSDDGDDGTADADADAPLGAGCRVECHG